MKLKIALSTATALGLLIGSAHAGSNNESYLDQIGEGNQASITQSGTGNRAGYDSPTVTFDRMEQSGDRNVLTINQSGGANTAGASGGGIDQQGDENDMSITQTGTSNVTAAGQRSSGTAANGSANSLTVNQTGASSNVSTVGQWNNSTSTTASQLNSIAVDQGGGASNWIRVLSQHGSGNSQDIDQVGTNNRIGLNSGAVASGVRQGHRAGSTPYPTSTSGTVGILQSGASNLIELVDQFGASNQASISQTGSGNKITTVSQTSLGAIGNSATFAIFGSNNGLLAAIDYAGGVNATASGATQIGDQNVINMSIGSALSNANDNRFGFFQDGTANQAVGISISGNENQLGVRQIGTSNAFALAPIAGNRNNVGINQGGTSNFATINVDGDDNDLAIGQSGTNSATAIITGLNNLASIQQNQQNTATLTISGDDNNRTGFTNPSIARTTALGAGLVAGLIVQDGFGNQFTLNVGSLTPSDGNQFAAGQNGNGNTITGTINGDGNQAVVVQLGSTNTTSFTQTGGNNLVSVQQ